MCDGVYLGWCWERLLQASEQALLGQKKVWGSPRARLASAPAIPPISPCFKAVAPGAYLLRGEQSVRGVTLQYHRKPCQSCVRLPMLALIPTCQ